ncbi:MAG: quinone-dependent dihydroorotate dehydrogenase [Alphaproteobacteria bacterium]|nr:quinone-dependent dihydroorotate dehydrogenase [Alphaproteobacteria bacterium]
MDLSRLTLPLLRCVDPERAHRVTLWGLRHGLAPVQREPDDPILASRVWGLEFPNPVGLCAGFDKNAEAYEALLRMGFGFVEIGTVTPRPQAGNPRPRIFRLPEDGALINRLGFNNEGLEAVAARVRHPRSGILGINIGKNKETADAAADYVPAARRLAPFADYMVINVSSPNTPGLRALQGGAALSELIAKVQDVLTETAAPPPLLVKIAPDLDAEGEAEIAKVALDRGVDGLIVSNTTVARPAGLSGRHRGEDGGLSGRPLFAASTELLARLYRLTEGRLPLVGVGGIANAEDAYAKIRAGASLVQLYTALVHQGPQLLQRIKEDMAQMIRRDGASSIADMVGADHR